MKSLDTAARFLGLLDKNDEFTFQTFPDSRHGPSATTPRVFHGSFDYHAAALHRLNDDGAGIFVMVNAGDGVTRPDSKTCRNAVNVTRVRAVFVDLDGAPIVPVVASALPPDWVVQSSPARWHAYWLVDDCELDTFAAAQAALAARFDGDPAVKDLPRVMRIPGFFHHKSEPFLSELYVPVDYPRIFASST